MSVRAGAAGMAEGTIETDDAPPAADYGRATPTDDRVFTAGQVALTPERKSLADEPVDVRAEQVPSDLAAVLSAAGADLGSTPKTTVHLADIDDYGTVNDVYGDYFGGDPPARSAVDVGTLPPGMAVEIEAVATRA